MFLMAMTQDREHLFSRHSREGGNDHHGWWKCKRIVWNNPCPVINSTIFELWIPAFAGMTVLSKYSLLVIISKTRHFESRIFVIPNEMRDLSLDGYGKISRKFPHYVSGQGSK